MNETKEPNDHHIYNWLSFNNDTFKFFLKSVEFYESLLEDDIKTIESDEDLSFLISDKEKRNFEIYEELKRVQRVENWFKEYFEKYSEDAWDYDVTSSHGNIRFLKSVGILFIEQLKKRRDSLANKPRLSKHALKAVDNKIIYFTEKTVQGVFKTTTPYPLFVDEIIIDTEETLQDIPESLVEESKDKSRPTPRIIDSIDIFDPELKYRCLDLFQSFQEDGQTDRLDTVVTEATKILENRLRKLSGAKDNCIGVDLAKFALSGENPKVVVSNISSEQEAAHLLFRGVFGYIRNHVHHQIVENLEPERVIQIIGLIDYLIYVVEDSVRSEPQN